MSNQSEPGPDESKGPLYEAYKALETDPKKALVELRLLAGKGSAMSMLYLGSAYRQGTGTSIDLHEAEQWYLRARAAGLVRAGYDLGRLYFDEKRYVDARKVFETAASQGFVPAIHFLGRIYYFGYGVPIDKTQGKALLESAARWGCIFAKALLAYDLMHQGSVRGVCKGVFVKVTCYIDMLKALYTEGLSSDRFR